jgi:hypothetical protein
MNMYAKEYEGAEVRLFYFKLPEDHPFIANLRQNVARTPRGFGREFRAWMRGRIATLDAAAPEANGGSGTSPPDGNIPAWEGDDQIDRSTDAEADDAAGEIADANEDERLLPRALTDHMNSIGARFTSFTRWVIDEKGDGGYTKERTVLKIGADGTITCKDKDKLPDEKTQAEICEAYKTLKLPEPITATNPQVRAFQLERGIDDEHFFAGFLDLKNAKSPHIMVQERIDLKQVVGKESPSKIYVAWQYFKDGWRKSEPDDLPLYRRSAKRTSNAALLVEGAKAARAVHRLCEAFKLDPGIINTDPWAVELCMFDTFGWIGGAHATDRQNVRGLIAQGYTEVLIVCDNDEHGKRAGEKLAQQFAGKVKVKIIMLDDKWKSSWDLADKLPEEFWVADGKGATKYDGPRMQDIAMPATWATKPIWKEGKIARYELTDLFLSEWSCIVKPNVFAHCDNPGELLSEDEFENKIAPFCHDAAKVEKIVDLMRRNQTHKAYRVVYRPNERSGLATSKKGGRIYNTYMPSDVDAFLDAEITDDDRAWIEDFFQMLLPVDSDREEVIRWCATLVCHPEIRMKYGIILASLIQGIGKSTLAKIVARLIGMWNVSFPSDADVSYHRPMPARRPIITFHAKRRFWRFLHRCYKNLQDNDGRRPNDINARHSDHYRYLLVIVSYSVALPLGWSILVHDPFTRRAVRSTDCWRKWYAVPTGQLRRKVDVAPSHNEA